VGPLLANSVDNGRPPKLGGSHLAVDDDLLSLTQFQCRAEDKYVRRRKVGAVFEAYVLEPKGRG